MFSANPDALPLIQNDRKPSSYFDEQEKDPALRLGGHNDQPNQ